MACTVFTKSKASAIKQIYSNWVTSRNYCLFVPFFASTCHLQGDGARIICKTKWNAQWLVLVFSSWPKFSFDCFSIKRALIWTWLCLATALQLATGLMARRNPDTWTLTVNWPFCATFGCEIWIQTFDDLLSSLLRLSAEAWVDKIYCWITHSGSQTPENIWGSRA